jgi:hypothetical protein
MSTSRPLIRLVNVYGNTRNLDRTGWYFRVLGERSKTRAAFFAHLGEILQKAYQADFDRFLALTQAKRLPPLFPYPNKLTLRPEPLIYMGRLDHPERTPAEVMLAWLAGLEELLSDENKNQVDLHKALDGLVRYELHNPDHSSFICHELDVKNNLAANQAHQQTVRNIWARYLPYFLNDSPVRSGLTRPDLWQEALLEYPLVDLLLIFEFLKKEPFMTPPNIFYLSWPLQQYTLESIEEGMARLVARGIIERLIYVGPNRHVHHKYFFINYDSPYEVEFVWGSEGQEFYHPPLPSF